MKGSNPPITVQMLVELVVPLTVTWWAASSPARASSLRAVGILDV